MLQLKHQVNIHTIVEDINVKEEWINNFKEIKCIFKERIIWKIWCNYWSGTVLMPFGGKYAKTPAEGMAAKIPVLRWRK